MKKKCFAWERLANYLLGSVALVICCNLSTTAKAVPYFWANDVDGNWSNASNWTPAGGPPTPSADRAFFGRSPGVTAITGNRVITVDVDIQPQRIHFDTHPTTDNIGWSVVSDGTHTLTYHGVNNAYSVEPAAGGHHALYVLDIPLILNADFLNGGDTGGTYVATGSTLRYAGPISQSGGTRQARFGYNGAGGYGGTVELSGAASNTYTGETSVLSGTLLLSKTGGAKAIEGNLRIATSGAFNPTVSLNGDNQFGATSVVSFSGSAAGAFLLNGHSTTVAGISSTNAAAIIQNDATGGSGTVGVLTVENSSPFTFAGIIRDRASGIGSALSLIKSGSSTLSLTGLNAYTGDTLVNQGILSISQAYLDDLALVKIESGATMDLLFGDTDLVGALTLGGVSMAPGIYNAVNTPAYFTGSGSLQVVPEPSSLIIMIGGLFALCRMPTISRIRRRVVGS